MNNATNIIFSSIIELSCRDSVLRIDSALSLLSGGTVSRHSKPKLTSEDVVFLLPFGNNSSCICASEGTGIYMR